MTGRHTTTRSRQLGAELKRVREPTGYSARDLARALGWSESKVSRMESGERGASEVAVATYLAYFRVVGPEMGRLLAMCRDIWAKDWLASGLGSLDTLIEHEKNASAIHDYCPLVLPGLLQTESYARALFRAAGHFDHDGVDLRVGVRLARRNLLRRESGVDLRFFISEQVLRTTLGSPQVMNEQLLHMLLVSSRPWCTVRVIPASFALGILGSQFRIMEFRNHLPVVYLETQSHNLYVEDPGDVRMYRDCLRKLREVALDEGRSRKLLATLANDYDIRGEAPDEVAEE
jgi:transcriptional regulator with XRE-family HTH domain